MIPQIDITKLSSQDLAALTKLVAERESLESRINAFVQSINLRNGDATAPTTASPRTTGEKASPVVAQPAKQPVRPEIKPVPPAILHDGKTKRGDFTSSMLNALKAAPQGGLSVNQLAEIVQRSTAQVRNWVHKVGPETPGFERIVQGRNTFFRINTAKGESAEKKPLAEKDLKGGNNPV
jgi:hypothetical protein